MAGAVLQFGILIFLYTYQNSLPLLSTGDTLTSYVLPVFVIIFRFIHFLRLMGLPINKSVAPFGEIALFGSSILFLFIGAYDEEYTLEIENILIVTGITLGVFLYEIINGILFYTIVVDEDDLDEEGHLK